MKTKSLFVAIPALMAAGLFGAACDYQTDDTLGYESPTEPAWEEPAEEPREPLGEPDFTRPSDQPMTDEPQFEQPRQQDPGQQEQFGEPLQQDDPLLSEPTEQEELQQQQGETTLEEMRRRARESFDENP